MNSKIAIFRGISARFIANLVINSPLSMGLISVGKVKIILLARRRSLNTNAHEECMMTHLNRSTSEESH